MNLAAPTRLPRGLLGMLALIGAVEVTLARLDPDFTYYWTCDWRVAGRAARSPAARGEVLCFGDSLTKFGVASRVIEARTGRSAYNLAICGGQPASSYFLLRRALRAGARPKVVVINCVPHLLRLGPRINVRQWPELLELREAFELASSARDCGLFAAILLGQGLTSLRCRHEIRVATLAAFRGEGTSPRSQTPGHRRNWRVNRGAQISPTNPDFNGEVDLGSDEVFPVPWSCDPVNAAYIRRFLRLAGSRGCRVVWLLPPVSPKAQAHRDRLGLDEQTTRFVRAMQARFPGVTVVDGRRSGYGWPLFMDPVHLNRHGAAAFSDDLAPILARCLAGEAIPRWIDLPAYRPRPEGVPLEDVDQSKLALKLREARRR